MDMGRIRPETAFQGGRQGKGNLRCCSGRSQTVVCRNIWLHWIKWSMAQRYIYAALRVDTEKTVRVRGYMLFLISVARFMIVMTMAAMRTHFNTDRAILLETEESTHLRGAKTGRSEAKKQYVSCCFLHRPYL